MLRKQELRNFGKMWTWLYEHPAHDQNYYIKNVAKLEDNWINNCPLCNNDKVKKCNGCSPLWESEQGNLCIDAESPLCKWVQITGSGDADKRSYYAGQLTRLAEKNLQKLR